MNYSFNTQLTYYMVQSSEKTMQSSPQARSPDLVHTHSGEKVSEVMFKSTFDLLFYLFQGL